MLSTRLRDKRISSLFVLRFICVFLIVCIHYPMAHSEWLQPLLRTAVPLFFMTSGYFLFSEKRNSTLKRIRRSLVKMTWIILYANIFFGCLKALAHMAGAADAIPLDSVAGWVKLIFVGNVVIEYLWYLTAYIEALLIFYIFFRFRKERLLILISPLLLILGLLLGKYSFLLGLHDAMPLYISRNFLTIALPSICIGYTLHRQERSILSRIGPALAPGAIVLVVAALTEGYLLQGTSWRMGDLFISSLPLAVIVFLCCLRRKDFGAGSIFDRMGEKHALNIYLFQALIAGLVIGAGNRVLGTDIEPYAAPLIFLGCLVFSTVVNHTHETLRR